MYNYLTRLRFIPPPPVFLQNHGPQVKRFVAIKRFNVTVESSLSLFFFYLTREDLISRTPDFARILTTSFENVKN